VPTVADCFAVIIWLKNSAMLPPATGALMRFDSKSANAILKILAVGSVIFFVAFAITSSAHPNAETARVLARNAAPQTSDSTCNVVLAALDKNFTTPYHMYMTQTSAAVQNGKPRSSEIISVGGMMYILVDAKWTARPNPIENQKANVAQAHENAKTGTCKYVRDEAVNGENATLISTHNKTEYGTSDSQIWISKSKGLILKQETDLDVGGTSGKSHSSARFDYNNVQAPKM
jgi:hypothetical protein